MDRNTDKKSDPRLAIIDEISGRLKAGIADTPDRMRVDLFVMDIVTVASQVTNDAPEEILEKVKKTRGFLQANTTFNIPDETITTLIDEARSKLQGS